MKLKLLFLLLLICTLNSCDWSDSKLRIKNSTPYDVYAICYDMDSLNDYPNKVLDLDFIPKDSIKQMWLFNQKWEEYVLNSRNGGLNLFIIESSVIKSATRDSIIENKLYYNQLFYTYAELERLEWFVTLH